MAAWARGSGLSDRVVVVANSDAPDSVAIAEHYSDVRGVPRANVIALKMPTAETITWGEFVASIWQPLEDELVRRGWIDAIPMDLVDEVHRDGVDPAAPDKLVLKRLPDRGHELAPCDRLCGRHLQRNDVRPRHTPDVRVVLRDRHRVGGVAVGDDDHPVRKARSARPGGHRKGRRR